MTAILVAALVAALERSEREHADMDEDAPLDAGCVLCTDGTTPYQWDTGLCAHHMRVRALADWKAFTAEGWMPIDSAPKDGTRVDLLGANGKQDDGTWYPFASWMNDECKIQRGISLEDTGEWSTANGEGPHTHWRPRAA